MTRSIKLGILRYAAALLVTAMFLFPLFWWALTSIKPSSAIFDIDRIVFSISYPRGTTTRLHFSAAAVLFDSRRTLSDSLGSPWGPHA